MNDTEFEHIATRLRPRLAATAMQTANALHLAEADVEDAVQESLVRLWRMGDRLDGYRSIESLGVTVVRNVCVDMARRQQLPTTSLDGPHGTIAVAADSSADSSLTAESTRGAVDRLIERLPATQQRLLRMRGEGMTLDEIAAITGMPKTSVKTLIARARRALLQRMKGEYIDNKGIVC